ncbi:cytochrome P450 [Mycena floridula]|nr:cytochrome P450 [Mycena floridula]
MVAILLLFLPVVYLLYRSFQRPSHSLPPGPQGIPILGNIFDVLAKDSARAFRDMSKKYNSGLIHLNILGTSLFVVNTRDVAERFFGQRNGSNYIDRPQFAMLKDLAGFDWSTFCLPVGSRWKDHRAFMHQELRYSSDLHDADLEEATKSLLSRLLNNPESFEPQLRHMNAMFMLSTMYGIQVKQHNDPYTAILAAGMKAFSAAAAPGTMFLFEALPWLKYLPSWLPGAGFQLRAQGWKKAGLDMRQIPLEAADGVALPSVAARKLSPMEDNDTQSPLNDQFLQDVLASGYAGSDSVVTVLTNFVLAMVQNPTVLKKAQAAVDKVLSGERIPGPRDYHSVPYIDALVKEVIRWKPVGSLMSYKAIRDDEYRGYAIPAGSTVVGNVWAMLNDVSVYGPDTEAFRPERFLKDGVLDLAIPHPTFAFGMGARRACPGQEMTEVMVWSAIAAIVTCFDICKAVDENGVEINPSGEYVSGLIDHPKPFPCVFRPRSSKTEALISI